jgi:uncharacterized protein YjiS (DUF1127 family)
MHLVMADSLAQDRTASPRSHGWLRAILRQPAVWFVRASSREELRALEPEQMKDCGLDPLEVRREALKPFWRE